MDGQKNKSAMINFLMKLGVPERYGNNVLIVFAVILYILTAVIIYKGLK